MPLQVREKKKKNQPKTYFLFKWSPAIAIYHHKSKLHLWVKLPHTRSLSPEAVALSSVSERDPVMVKMNKIIWVATSWKFSGQASWGTNMAYTYSKGTIQLKSKLHFVFI